MQNMNQALQKNPSTDNNISKTGYRALFLLKKLMESPKSREELLECFEQDIVIKNDISKDTILIALIYPIFPVLILFIFLFAFLLST